MQERGLASQASPHPIISLCWQWAGPLRIAIWALVHREGRFILVAIDDRLENIEGEERDNRSNENKEDSNTGNERMFSGWGQISDA